MEHTRKYYDSIIDIRKLRRDSYLQQYDLLKARVESLKTGCCSNLLCLDIECLEGIMRTLVDDIKQNRDEIDRYDNIVMDMIS